MKRFLLLSILTLNLWANETSNLIKALHSDNLSLGIIEQQGVFLTPKVNLGSENSTDFKVGTSMMRFTGLGLLKSNYNPTLIDEIGDPAFMFNIRLKGDAIEFGGSVRNLKLGDWTEFINNINKKSENGQD
ncbi:MAG: hypothetical protein LBF13_07190 [Campylobacteraceae bacterium]|nr:hypothetical protein [Campylobacteraceae bacterium]